MWPDRAGTTATSLRFRGATTFPTTLVSNVSSPTDRPVLSLDSDAVHYTDFGPAPLTRIGTFKSLLTVWDGVYRTRGSSGDTDPVFKPAPLAIIVDLGISGSSVSMGPWESVLSSLAAV